MVRIYMTETAFGVPEGSYNPRGYVKGRIYNIDNNLALVFIKQGVARLLKEEYEIESPLPEYETKVIKQSTRKRGRPPKSKNAESPLFKNPHQTKPLSDNAG